MRRFLAVIASVLLAGSWTSARAGPVTLGVWNEFSFTDVGVEARGCFPADMDPSALDCLPSSAGNSVFAPAPQWTFVATPGASTLVVTDAFLYGDSFDVFDNGVLIFSTPMRAADGGCGDNPDVCFADPKSSHAGFDLSLGPHSITIFPDAIADAGAAYFEVVAEPPGLAVTFGLFAVAILLVRKRRGQSEQKRC